MKEQLWEIIASENFSVRTNNTFVGYIHSVSRLSVPGGWIYKEIKHWSGSDVKETMCFVPAGVTTK